MKIRSISLAALSCAFLLLAGCRTSHVLNIENQSIVTNLSQHSSEDVKKAIIRAGATLGWIMSDNQPGKIIATLNIRAHMAQVTIDYDQNKYSITYKESMNLKYKSNSGSIHSNYNGWVQNLNNSILAQLGTL